MGVSGDVLRMNLERGTVFAMPWLLCFLPRRRVGVPLIRWTHEKFISKGTALTFENTHSELWKHGVHIFSIAHHREVPLQACRWHIAPAQPAFLLPQVSRVARPAQQRCRHGEYAKLHRLNLPDEKQVEADIGCDGWSNDSLISSFDFLCRPLSWMKCQRVEQFLFPSKTHTQRRYASFCFLWCYHVWLAQSHSPMPMSFCLDSGLQRHDHNDPFDYNPPMVHQSWRGSSPERHVVPQRCGLGKRFAFLRWCGAFGHGGCSSGWCVFCAVLLERKFPFGFSLHWCW